MGIQLFLFLLWPLGSVITSLKHYRSSVTKNIIWLFVIYYGANFVISNDTMDANRLREKFEFFIFNDFNFSGVLSLFFFDNKDGVDIIQPIILYLAAKITDNFYVVLGGLASIFGFFYSRNIAFLLDRKNGSIRLYNYLILSLFIFVVGFWQINGFRFWTSAVIFFFSVIPFVYNGERKHLWLALTTILLHFSFIYINLAILIYVLLRDKAKFYFLLFIFSFSLFMLNVSSIGEILVRILPSNYQYKISAYTDANSIAELNEAAKSISNYLKSSVFFMLNAIFFLLYIYDRKQIMGNKKLYSLFNFCLLVMAMANSISIVPSGIRFVYLSSMFSLSFIFFYYQMYTPSPQLKLILKVATPIFVFGSFGFLRNGMDTIGFLTVFGNPAITMLVDYRVALIEYFK